MRGRDNMQRNRSIVFVVATCVLCLARVTICDVGTQNVVKSLGNEKDKKPDHVAPSPKIEDAKEKSKPPSVGPEAKTGTDDVTSKPNKPSDDKSAVPNDAPATSESPEVVHATSLNSGALLRGFYVFVGLSMIALAYMVFRSFRLNKSRTQMVRKYGVLAHKQDMEMRPLPLDEDDEDDTTVFDAAGLAPPRPQS